LAAIIALKINGTEYKIDCALEGFTGGELNAIERNTGMPWRDWLEKLGDHNVSSLAWTGLAWLAVRRSGVPVEWDEFEDTLKVMELLESVEPEETQTVAQIAKRTRARTST
jgi:heme oxygenase